MRDAIVSVTFVSDRRMAALNWRHLQHRGATDVISFGFAPVTKGGALTGDVYIAPDVARRNALAHGAGIREELLRLVVHGVLHVLGYDHPVDEATLRVADVAPAGTLAAQGVGERMNGTALIVATGAITIATLAAAADGALLGGDPEPEPAPPVVGVLRSRERAHRALALSRVLAHLIAGAALARLLGIQRGDGITGAGIALAAALGVVILVEGVGRSLGFATAPRFILSFAPLVRALEVVLSPVLRLGVALDNAVRAADARAHHRGARRAARGRRPSSFGRSSRRRRMSRATRRRCCTASSRSATPRCAR